MTVRLESVDCGHFYTDAHRRAPAACRHVIGCAVDAATRRAVVEHIADVRRIGDVGAVPILIA